MVREWGLEKEMEDEGYERDAAEKRQKKSAKGRQKEKKRTGEGNGKSKKKQSQPRG